MRKRTGRLAAFVLILCLLAGAAAADGIHTEVENPLLEADILLAQPDMESMDTYIMKM